MINLVIAMTSEAKPLIEHFGLSAVAGSSSPTLFDGSGLSLAISGIGKPASYRAVSALAARSGGRRDRGWLNIGLAGHRSHDVGEVFLARSIEDARNGEHWRPPPILTLNLRTAPVKTVEVAELDYPEDVLYDMEASAFVAAASRFSRPELVQVLKVVSDNPRRPTGMLTAALARDLISRQIPLIEQLISQLRRLLEARFAGSQSE